MQDGSRDRTQFVTAGGVWIGVPLLVACGISFTAGLVEAAEKLRLSIDDLYRYDGVTDVVPLPGGERAFYVREWARPGEKYRRLALWVAVQGASLNTSAVEPDEPDARKLVLSPDGKWLAFLSTRPLGDGTRPFRPVPIWSDPATEIWLMRTSGGPAIPLAGKGKPYGRVFSDPFYAGLKFSPDGGRLAFVADDGAEVRGDSERELNITVVKEDQGEGYEGFRPAQVWLADLKPLLEYERSPGTATTKPPTAAATSFRKLTEDDAWYGDPQWTPDGKSLVVHANRTSARESVRFSINRNFDLWRIDVATRALTALTRGPGPQVSPRISPDGARVACLSVPRNGPHADIYDIEVIDLDGPPLARVLTAHHTPGTSERRGIPPSFPLPERCWLDNRWLAVNGQEGLKSSTLYIDTRSRPERVQQELPIELETAKADIALRRRLTPPSQAYLTDRVLGDERTVTWKSPDGLSIEGSLTTPPADVASAPYPLIVFPHGGPHSRSTTGFNFTAQIFAAHGYAVFQPNFRGSMGYDRKFLDADRNDLGGGDMRDILSGIEHLVKEGVADRERQFLYGVSYGGFMTTWLIGQTGQFRAAVPQNPVTDLNVMWGTSDIPSWTEWEFGGKPWEVAEAMRQHSPFTHAHKVSTPTLILHADHDRRCPIAMGTMYHRVLQSRGVPVEMVIYHDERHTILRLDHQADILRRTLAWFKKYDVKP